MLFLFLSFYFLQTSVRGYALRSGPKADVVESAALVHFFTHDGEMTAIGIYWCYTLSLVQPGQDFETKALSTRVTAFYAITLSLNFICTSTPIPVSPSRCRS